MSINSYEAVPVHIRSGADFVEFALPSETSKPATSYIVHVDVATPEVRCTCKDYEIRRVERGETCKHGTACFKDQDAGWLIWQKRESYLSTTKAGPRLAIAETPTHQANGGPSAT